jgi:exonuclease V
MASSATVCSVPLDDIDTDYGSDFSPEEEVIIQQLLSRDTASSITPEDESPIVNDIQYHNAWHALHLPRTLSGEEKSLLFQAARAAEQITKEITQSIRGENYSDCG